MTESQFRSPRLWGLALLILASLALSACRGVQGPSWPNMSLGDDTLYVAGITSVYAINPRNGNLRWQFPDEDQASREAKEFYAEPTISDSLVIAGSYNQSAFALDSDGNFRWSFDGQPDRSSTAPTSTSAADGSLYMTAGDTLYALDLSGGEKWRFTAAAAIWAAPATDGKFVYQPSMDHHLYALDRETGEEAWSLELDGALADTPTLSEGTLYLGALSNRAYAVDAATGEINWTLDTAGWVWSSPVVQDGTVYFGDLNGTVHAVDAETGTERWTPRSLDSAVRGAPALVGETLFVNTEGGFLYAMDRSDGAAHWKVEVGNEKGARLLATPVIVNDLVVVATLNAEHLVYAYNMETGAPVWQFKPEA